MKSKIFLPGVITLLILLSGCEKLDRRMTTDLTADEVAKSWTYTQDRVASVYSSLQNGFINIDGAMMASATDEAEHTQETSAIQKFNYGSWNAVSNPDNVWAGYYQGIRKANEFLSSSDSVNLDLYKFDPDQQDVYFSRLATIKQWKYEVRFLRAFFYFELVKRYGGVPIITKVYSLKDDYNNVKRDSLQKCIRFITSECDSCAANLPATYANTDLGRVTKGAALSLKSRMLLYAASDLYNTPSWASGYDHPELISLTGDRAAKWQAAANAAKAVIDLGVYSLPSLSTTYTLFGASGFRNAEVIFCRRNGASNSFESASFPVGYDMGNSGTTPSQNLVDDYEVKVNSTTSVPFDWNNPAMAANPYATSGATARDPRLSNYILTNNTDYMGRPVECWTGGRDGKGIAFATKTGYYLKKYVNSTLSLLTGQTAVHSWIFIRYAEVCLNYAEALNECNPGNANIKTYVDNVRKRAGVAMPGLPSGLSQSQMRDAIRHERRIELAFEDHRFWDVRRWMTAPAVLGAPLKGVEITKVDESTFNYNVITVEDRVFQPKMYFYPIPQNEMIIDKGLVQNPLW